MSDITGFMKSRVILTGAELDIFTRLDLSPETLSGLAKETGLNRRSLERLVDALTALGFLEKKDGMYSLTEKGALLSSRRVDSVLPMVLHMNRIWETWGDLSSVVRKGTRGKRKHTDRMDPAALEAFIGAMDVIGRDLSTEVVNSYDPGPCKKLLDIGGASGTYTIAFLRKYPALHATIFDLDSVIPMARTRIQTEGLTDRVDLAAGDFTKDDLPGGHDLVLLSAIIHQNDAQENIDLYRKAFNALISGGKIVIRDHIMEDDRTAPVSGALFAINMLVNTRGGNTYTFKEIRKELKVAGFENIRLMRKGDRMDGLVEAVKP
ncbi:MAG: methyltransferase protein [Deltaproteobacteria bacterium]|nr:methyltransferase protein [Deltaproteobacteria bacterium]